MAMWLFLESPNCLVPARRAGSDSATQGPWEIPRTEGEITAVCIQAILQTAWFHLLPSWPWTMQNSSGIKLLSYSSLQSAAYAGAYAVLGEFELVFLSHVLELLKERCLKNCIDTFIFSSLSKENMVDISVETAISFLHLRHWGGVLFLEDGTGRTMGCHVNYESRKMGSFLPSPFPFPMYFFFHKNYQSARTEIQNFKMVYLNLQVSPFRALASC